MGAVMGAIIGAIIGGVAGFCLEFMSCVVDVATCSGGGVEMWSLTIPCAVIGGIIGLLIGIFAGKEEAVQKKRKKSRNAGMPNKQNWIPHLLNGTISWLPVTTQSKRTWT